MLLMLMFIHLQEMELMQNSLSSLKFVQNKFSESKESLNQIVAKNKGKQILVPLTSSVSLVPDMVSFSICWANLMFVNTSINNKYFFLTLTLHYWDIRIFAMLQ